MASIEAERIAEDADYEGIRVRLRGSLGTAQIVMQLDIDFGDIVVPSPEPTYKGVKEGRSFRNCIIIFT